MSFTVNKTSTSLTIDESENKILSGHLTVCCVASLYVIRTSFLVCTPHCVEDESKRDQMCRQIVFFVILGDLKSSLFRFVSVVKVVIP
jgi:hypothetical protein